jgi:hypothetical protein
MFARILYRLFKKEKQIGVFVKQIEQEFDVESGEIGIIKEEWSIPVVIFDEDMKLEFGQQLGVPFGGLFPVGHMQVIVDQKDLQQIEFTNDGPVIIKRELTKNDTMFLAGAEYVIEAINEVRNHSEIMAYLLVVKDKKQDER